jgi:hypothetical protein
MLSQVLTPLAAAYLPGIDMEALEQRHGEFGPPTPAEYQITRTDTKPL